MNRRRPLGWRLHGAECRRLLILGNLLVSAPALWAQLDWLRFTGEFVHFRAGLMSLPPLAWVGQLANLYDLRRVSSMRRIFRAVLLAAGTGLAICALIHFALVRPTIQRPSDLAVTMARRGPRYFPTLATLLPLDWRWLLPPGVHRGHLLGA